MCDGEGVYRDAPQLSLVSGERPTDSNDVDDGRALLRSEHRDQIAEGSFPLVPGFVSSLISTFPPL